MKLYDLLHPDGLRDAFAAGHVRAQDHPSLPLRILNYTESCAYEGAWTPTTLVCRGLIYDTETHEVVARPFPKFFNYGQPGAPDLDLDAPAVVTDKLDGSLGILYPTGAGVAYPTADGADMYAVATRGSFTSDQALHATEVWQALYAEQAYKWLRPGLTYLFEIIYPENRIVVDYDGLDNLVLLAAVSISSGRPSLRPEWPGPRVTEFHYRTLADALTAEPRPNCEGLVVYLPDADARVKIKQDDYVALHRILTGTNARNVWEVAAVRACAGHVTDPKQWGSYLRIDPARAAEVLALGDGWLAEVPDEFYEWIGRVTAECESEYARALTYALSLIEEAKSLDDRRQRYELVGSSHPAAKEILRIADGRTEEYGRLEMRCWLMAQPEPTAPFARSEAVA